jgi:hypothetical protein
MKLRGVGGGHTRLLILRFTGCGDTDCTGCSQASTEGVCAPTLVTYYLLHTSCETSVGSLTLRGVGADCPYGHTVSAADMQSRGQTDCCVGGHNGVRRYLQYGVYFYNRVLEPNDDD